MNCLNHPYSHKIFRLSGDSCITDLPIDQGIPQDNALGPFLHVLLCIKSVHLISNIANV